MPTVGGIVVATGGEATGRRTLSEVVDELARPIDASDDTVRNLAADSFRAAVRTMNRKGLWPWEILDEDITLAANERLYTISGPVKKPLAMHLLDSAAGTPNQRIEFMAYDRFVERYSMDEGGQPHTYTIPNLFETGQVRFFPVPPSTDYARFTYYRVTPAPRNMDEVVEIPEYAMDAYINAAWYEFAKRHPATQTRIPLQVAKADALLAFRELAAHAADPGDRSRYTQY